MKQKICLAIIVLGILAITGIMGGCDNGQPLANAWWCVPIFAVIYNLLRESCHDSLKKKGVDYTSETYEKIDHIDEHTKSPIWFE